LKRPVQEQRMKWCLTITFVIAALGGASEVASDDPPSLEGLVPSQIEKIMIEEILGDQKKKKKKGAKGSDKAPFDFTKTVKPILEQFKKQLLDDKKKMQQELNDDIKAIKKCIDKMKKSTKKGLLLEMDKKKKKKDKKKQKCPTKADVKKCVQKIKNLKPKQKACDELKGIGKKDIDAISELIKKWNKQKVLKKDCVQDKGETKFHYVNRLSNHFKNKLAAFKKRIDELVKKKDGGKALDKGCNAIKHYARRLVEVTCQKIKDDNYQCTCDKVIHEKKICSMFDGCYAASVAAYKSNAKEIRKKNAAAKLEWRAVGRIECLIKVMSGKDKADEKQLEKCVKGPQVSTRPLDLIYPKIPAKPKCQLKGVKEETRKLCAKGAQEQKKKKEIAKAPAQKVKKR